MAAYLQGFKIPTCISALLINRRSAGACPFPSFESLPMFGRSDRPGNPSTNRGYGGKGGWGGARREGGEGEGRRTMVRNPRLTVAPQPRRGLYGQSRVVGQAYGASQVRGGRGAFPLTNKTARHGLGRKTKAERKTKSAKPRPKVPAAGCPRRGPVAVVGRVPSKALGRQYKPHRGPAGAVGRVPTPGAHGALWRTGALRALGAL